MAPSFKKNAMLVKKKFSFLFAKIKKGRVGEKFEMTIDINNSKDVRKLTMK